MKIYSKDYRVKPGEKVKLKEWPTVMKPTGNSKKQNKKLLKERVKKLSSDIRERKYWEHYMKAYEACLNATSSHYAPWYVVPADDKENARLIVSQIMLDALNGLKMNYPKTGAKRKAALRSIRKLLTK